MTAQPPTLQDLRYLTHKSLIMAGEATHTEEASSYALVSIAASLAVIADAICEGALQVDVVTPIATEVVPLDNQPRRRTYWRRRHANL